MRLEIATIAYSGGWDLYSEPELLEDRVAVAQVELTRHLYEHFPALPEGPLAFDARTVAELIQQLEAEVPGIAFYLCDELGRLRQHVNIFVEGEMIVDRQTLSDNLKPQSPVFISQALSGG